MEDQAIGPVALEWAQRVSQSTVEDSPMALVEKDNAVARHRTISVHFNTIIMAMHYLPAKRNLSRCPHLDTPTLLLKSTPSILQIHHDASLSLWIAHCRLCTVFWKNLTILMEDSYEEFSSPLDSH